MKNSFPCGTPRLPVALLTLILILPVALAGAAVAPGPGDPALSAATSPAPAWPLIVLTRIPVMPSESGAVPSALLSSGTFSKPDAFVAQEEPLPPGSQLVLFDPNLPKDSPKRVRVLTRAFAAAGKADVSYDGRRILFLGRRTAQSEWLLWEMNVDGTGLRCVVSEASGVSDAFYASTMYTIDADRPTDRIGFVAAWADESGGGENRGQAGRLRHPPAIYTCLPAGRRIRRITFHPYGASNPLLLSDGRLLHTTWAYPGGVPRADAKPRYKWLSVMTDGADLFLFRDVEAGGKDVAAGDPVRPAMPCEVGRELVVFVETLARPDALLSGGRLAYVRRARPLAEKRYWPGQGDLVYHSPAALDGHRLLVAAKLGGPAPAGSTAHAGTGERRQSFGLQVLDRRLKRIGGVTLLDDPRWHEVFAKPVQPRRVVAGRSSVVDERRQTGQLYALDATISDGESDPPLTHEDIRKIRIWRSVARWRADARAFETSQSVLGESAVARDGSFFLDLPAKAPIRLELLGEDGQSLRSMDSWFWVMPREGRGCIGCHEDREMSPPDVHPDALRQAPVRMKTP